MMFCLLNQAHYPRMNFGGMHWYSDNRIPGDANRFLSGAYCDLSDVSGYIIKISLVFFLHRSFVFGGSICSCCWDTVCVETPSSLLLLVFE